MMVVVALLLVALATSDVKAQVSHEYDLLDCTINQIADQTHHSDDPDNCRVFYNCDNTNGGKLVHCPEGTIYNSTMGICLSSGDCRVWNRLCSCSTDATRVCNFPGQCCNTFFEYQCRSRSFTFKYCPAGQTFTPNRNTNSMGSCGNQPPSNDCMRDCQSTISVSSDPCDDTKLVPVPPCQFKHRGSDHVMTCAPGTAMSTQECMCVRDDAGACTSWISQPGCQTKHRFNFAKRTFQFGPSVTVNSPEFQRNAIQSDEIPIYYLSGQDFGYTPFATLLRVSFQAQPRNAAILTASQSLCNNLVLEVVIVSQTQTRVTLKDRNLLLTLEGQCGNPGSLDYTVRVVFDLANLKFQASCNGAALQPTLSSQPNFTDLMRRLRTSGVTTACLLALGNVNGRILDFAYWRGCANLASLT